MRETFAILLAWELDFKVSGLWDSAPVFSWGRIFLAIYVFCGGVVGSLYSQRKTSIFAMFS